MNSITEKNRLKKKFGTYLSKIRNKRMYSQRELARRINLSNSNLKYIEDGVNAPSPNVYSKLINELVPSLSEREEMDRLYSKIRGTPPPDICEYLIENSQLYSIIRSEKNLSETLIKEQISSSIKK